MTYSKSKKAVRKVQSYLDQLLTADRNISFPHKNPTKLNYSIREGISASQHHLDTKKYSNLNSKFIIRNAGLHVLCELRDTLELEKQLIIAPTSFPDAVTALQVLTVAIKQHGDIMEFPNANFESMKTPITSWADKNGYAVEDIDGISLKLIRENANPKEDNNK